MSPATARMDPKLDYRRRRARLFSQICAGLTWLAVVLLGIIGRAEVHVVLVQGDHGLARQRGHADAGRDPSPGEDRL